MNDRTSTVEARSRASVPTERTWDAESLFTSQEAWEEELERVLADVPRLSEYAGRLAESPSVLRDALDAREELATRADKVSIYAYVGYAVETTNPEAVARLGRAMSLGGTFSAAVAFLVPELLEIGRETLLAWQDEDDGLAVYGHYLDDLLRQQPHVRSGDVEEALGLVSDPFSGATLVHSALTDSDLRFEPASDSGGAAHVVTQGTIDALLANADRDLRRTAWESYSDGFLSLRNALAGNYQTAVKQDVFRARVRRHDSTLLASLSRANVPVEVFDNVIATFRANLPVWHRYWDVRRGALGLDEHLPYDVWAPLGSPVEVEYEQAVEWICEALAPLGSDYVETTRRGCLEERWVDVYPTEGKMGGAFSSGTQGTHPFIVMNYDETMTAVGTLAHELGHSLHSYLAWKTQPPVYADYSLFAAEVASNFHQVLLRAHLLETSSDRALRLAVLDEAFANFHRYLFVMPILAAFEREVHELVERGEGLAAPLLIERMADLFADGFGPDTQLDRERVGITWAQFGHLYSTFYVYQYTTGISGAHALGRAVLDGDPGAAGRYLAFVSAGGSRYPIDALREAGVDLASPEPIESAFETLSSLVDELEKLAGA